MSGRRAGLVVVGALVLAGCALTSDPRPVHRAEPAAGGRTLVVGLERDPANAQTVVDLSRELAFGLAGQGRAAVALPDFLIDAEAAGRPVPDPVRARLVSGLADAEAVGWLRGGGVRQVVFLEVKVYDQVWTNDGKRTRVGLVARGRDLEGTETWYAQATPDVVDEPGRGFQLGNEAAVDAIVRAVSGEPPATRLPRVTFPYLPPLKVPW